MASSSISSVGGLLLNRVNATARVVVCAVLYDNCVCQHLVQLIISTVKSQGQRVRTYALLVDDTVSP